MMGKSRNILGVGDVYSIGEDGISTNTMAQLIMAHSTNESPYSKSTNSHILHNRDQENLRKPQKINLQRIIKDIDLLKPLDESCIINQRNDEALNQLRIRLESCYNQLKSKEHDLEEQDKRLHKVNQELNARNKELSK